MHEEGKMSNTAGRVIRRKVFGNSLSFPRWDIYQNDWLIKSSGKPRAKNLCFFLEFSAMRIVESVGEGVTDLAPGDHFLPVFTGECKECTHCKSEKSNMCDLLRINTDRGVMIHDQKSRFSINNKPIFHFVGTSTFSKYTVVHVGCLAKINPRSSRKSLCSKLWNLHRIWCHCECCQANKGLNCGCLRIGSCRPSCYRRGARVSGASRIIEVRCDRVCETQRLQQTSLRGTLIAEMTNGGVDRSIECTGSTEAMISAFECVHDWVGEVGEPPLTNLFHYP
ncbi:unnamed protein product [Camellia sinensis]